jgi:hypothetical protein
MQTGRLRRTAIAGTMIVTLGLSVAACKPRVVDTSCGPLGRVTVTVAFDVDRAANFTRQVRVVAKSATPDARRAETTVNIPAMAKGTFKAKLTGLTERATYRAHVSMLWNGAHLGSTDEFTPSCGVHTMSAN